MAVLRLLDPQNQRPCKPRPLHKELLHVGASGSFYPEVAHIVLPSPPLVSRFAELLLAVAKPRRMGNVDSDRCSQQP